MEQTAKLRIGYTASPIKMKPSDARYAEYTVNARLLTSAGVFVRSVPAEKISDTEWRFFNGTITTEKEGIYFLEVSATLNTRKIFIGKIKIQILK